MVPGNDLIGDGALAHEFANAAIALCAAIIGKIARKDEQLRLHWLGQQMPEGPWLYPEDQIADLPLRMIAAETTREKLTLRLHQELP